MVIAQNEVAGGLRVVTGHGATAAIGTTIMTEAQEAVTAPEVTLVQDDRLDGTMDTIPPPQPVPLAVAPHDVRSIAAHPPLR